MAAPPSNFQFLVHAEDGSFPCLTEYLLKTYFNPGDEIVKNHLLIGVAVKDTCVVPVYKEKQGRNLKRKRSIANNNNLESSSGNDAISREKESVITQKPTGYTFNSLPIQEQTRLLVGYRTMTLPTFDLLDDAQSALDKEKAAKTNKPQKNAKKSDKNTNIDRDKMVPSVTSTRDKLSLNSPNGMQQITPKMYTEVALKLKCDSILALYDQVHSGDGKNRKAAAGERTKLWLDICMSTLEASSNGKKVPLWASFSCYEDEWSYKKSCKYLKEKGDLLAGISIAGWHRIEARHERNKLLDRIMNDLQQLGTKYSILAASNMEQILDAIQRGVSIVGSALPVIWARSNKALALSLDPEESLSTNAINRRLLDGDGCIDLSNSIYRHDTSPIVQGCRCLTCRDDKYTASYLHHLINAKELLAQILLFGHNLHHMLLLFEKLSTAAKDDGLNNLCKSVEGQLGA